MTDVNPSSDSEWKVFSTRLEPYLPGNLWDLRHVPLSELLGEDRVRVAFVKLKLAELLEAPPDELMSAITTLADAFGWYQARVQHETSDSSSTAPSRSFEDCLKTMRTKTQRLRPVLTSDLPLLYQSAVDPRWNWRFRHRGYTPSFQDFSSGLWSGVACQYIVERLDDTPIGHVLMYNFRPESGIAYFAVSRVTSASSAGTEMMEGIILFLGLCFKNWNIRKLYAEIPGFNWQQFAGGVDFLLDVEGELVDYDYYDGRFWTQTIAAVSRTRFLEQVSPGGLVGELVSGMGEG